MRPLFLILLIGATCLPASAQRFVKVFDNVAALLAANPNDVHTNAFVAGHTTANDGGGGLYTWNSTSTVSTNAVILKPNNFSTGRWFRQNGFVLTDLTGDRVGVIGADNVLTNSDITITELASLSGIDGNIQAQIDGIVSGDSNWANNGATNAILAGIATAWKGMFTDSVDVGQSGEAGIIEISSTNGTYTIATTVDANGTLIIRYGTTNMLTLALGAGAGWTGTGNNFLADDGTFKEVSGGGSGDTIWTNDNGTITSTSTVADGGPAYTLVSSNLMTGGNPFFSLFNQTNEFFYVSDDAAISMTGSFPSIYMEDASGTNNMYLDHLGQVAAKIADVFRMDLNPLNTDGNPTVMVDSAIVHTTGPMAQFRNETTNIFSVAAVSGYGGGGIRFLTDQSDGTYRIITLGTDTTGNYAAGDAEAGGATLIRNAATDTALASAGEMALNTTDEQLSFHSAADGEISGEASISLLQHKSWSFDPDAVCDGAVDRLFLMTIGDDAPEGIRIVEWRASFEADPITEVDLDLKFADAFIGVANSAVIDVLDTTAGVSSEDTNANINSGNAIANGKVLYLEFGTAYTETGHQIIFEMFYYAEED